jgi:hypothetical protein
MHDKRKYQRFNLENNILLKFESYPAKTIQGKLLNIGFVGLSIFLKENVNVDAIVQFIVQYDFPGSPEHLVGKGRIVYASQHRLDMQDGFKIGLEFIEVDKKFLVNIISVLRSKILEQIRKKS